MSKLFACKATLVLCPGHLVEQWGHEIQKYAVPVPRVYLIPTIRELCKLTFSELARTGTLPSQIRVILVTNYLKTLSL